MTARNAAATVVITALLAALALLAGPPAAADPTPSRVGAPGLGDPYFRLDGNGGYDVAHYDLGIDYAPTRRWLTGTTTIEATATQALSRFDLDLVGLTVSAITVDGRPATWTRRGQELIITPATALRPRQRFTTVVRYAGTPVPLQDFGLSGVIPTSDGLVVAGEPHGAASWFPVNDHPLDKASYTFRVTAPRGLEVVANGRLESVRHRRTTSTWTWQATEPMASYLATANIGEFELRTSVHDGVSYTDAIAPSLFTPPARPRTGTGFALGTGRQYYQRLSYTLDVPKAGADLSFWLHQVRDGGYVVVEAHTPGRNDWTTLEEANGHTTRQTEACYLSDEFTFLRHYLTILDDEGGCDPYGSTGTWWGSSGFERGYQPWTVDLADWRGKKVEVSISHVGYGGTGGAFVDDVGFSNGVGRTSFEDDGNTLDGWTIGAAPAGSPADLAPWRTGGADDVPSLGEAARGALARQPEVIAFLSRQFGPYPFSTAGGIVDDVEGLGFALETQTRPIYSRDFFEDGEEIGSYVVAHETAHQWFGDSLSVQHWRDIWLNEGFATYAEWLWAEHEGEGTPQEIFDSFSAFPDDLWDLRIGDPGPNRLFDGQVYLRGALTLHALRMEIGDAAFFRLLQEWARTRAGGNVSTSDFVRLAETTSGQSLDAFFADWLDNPGRPAGLPHATARSRAEATAGLSPTARVLVERRWGPDAPRR